MADVIGGRARLFLACLHFLPALKHDFYAMPTATKRPFGRHNIFKTGPTTHPNVPVVTPEFLDRVLEQSKLRSEKLIPYTYIHPTNGLPIYGFADLSTLEKTVDGNTSYLSIMPKDFAEPFIPALKGAKLNQVSVGLGEHDEIVHLGLCDRPRVAGLGKVFADGGDSTSVVELVFASDDLGSPVKTAFGYGSNLVGELQWRFRMIADWMQSDREKSIATTGDTKEADSRYPQRMIDNMRADLPQEEPQGQDGTALAPNFAEHSTEETDMNAEDLAALKEKAARVDTLESEVSTLKTAFAESEKEKTAREIDALLTANAERIGADRPALEFLLTTLKGIPEKKNFAEPDGTEKELTAYDLLVTRIKAAKPLVGFGEVATPENCGDAKPEKPTIKDGLKAVMPQ